MAGTIATGHVICVVESTIRHKLKARLLKAMPHLEYRH